MRSNSSYFTLGVWGLRVCSLIVAQPFATVRNRPQAFARDRYGRAYMASSATVVTFGGSTCCVAPFRVVGVALRDIPRVRLIKKIQQKTHISTVKSCFNRNTKSCWNRKVHFFKALLKKPTEPLWFFSTGSCWFRMYESEENEQLFQKHVASMWCHFLRQLLPFSRHNEAKSGW